MIDKELLDILACPLCKTEVELENDKIVCTNCGRRYPIKDDIPVMLIDEAELPKIRSELISFSPAIGIS
jgi:uncharacterized protein YbaR (Trm112 family)